MKTQNNLIHYKGPNEYRQKRMQVVQPEEKPKDTPALKVELSKDKDKKSEIEQKVSDNLE